MKKGPVEGPFIHLVAGAGFLPPRFALRSLSPAVNRRFRAGPIRVNLLSSQNQILPKLAKKKRRPP